MGDLVNAQAGREPEPPQARSRFGGQEQRRDGYLDRSSHRVQQLRTPRPRLAALPHRDALTADDPDLVRELVLGQPSSLTRGAQCRAVDGRRCLHGAPKPSRWARGLRYAERHTDRECGATPP